MLENENYILWLTSAPPDKDSGERYPGLMGPLVRSRHHFLFLDNVEKNQEKFKSNFEKNGKWSICSKRANAPFSIIFGANAPFSIIFSNI